MSNRRLPGFTVSLFARRCVRATLCLVALGLAACAGTGQPSGDAGAVFPPVDPKSTATSDVFANAQGTQDYLIGPQDLLKIEVFGVEAMNRSVRVSSTGKIDLPLIGLVQAAGLTSEQLVAEITARLTKDYMQNPQVIIFIEEYTSQRVTVVGAVKKPGVYPVKGRTTLLQVVAGAEGPTSVANIRSVKVLRPGPGGIRGVVNYDLVAIREGRAPDPEIHGEDLVQVDTSMIRDTIKQASEFVLPFWVIGTVL
ncbi:MAG TPA: polysaccharide biosynthesis/export family protein [Lamprocystis sp. (in: g-proteobacteria)]|nr:polysaccharide biosynthesis/export family protein [Lamprocystis sp. (in: g-proteobacteria)]